MKRIAIEEAASNEFVPAADINEEDRNGCSKDRYLENQMKLHRLLIF